MQHLWTPWRLDYLRSDKPKVDKCIFCEALATPENDAQTFVLHRGDHSFIILNLYPYNNGHLMIVPNAHQPSIEQLSPDTLAEMMTLSRRSLELLRRAYAPHAFNVGINIGEAAGAGVPGHVHMHVVPRWQADTNFMTTLGATRVIPEWVAQTYQRLRELWQA